MSSATAIRSAHDHQNHQMPSFPQPAYTLSSSALAAGFTTYRLGTRPGGAISHASSPRWVNSSASFSRYAAACIWFGSRVLASTVITTVTIRSRSRTECCRLPQHATASAWRNAHREIRSSGRSAGDNPPYNRLPYSSDASGRTLVHEWRIKVAKVPAYRVRE